MGSRSMANLDRQKEEDYLFALGSCVTGSDTRKSFARPYFDSWLALLLPLVASLK
jgi:hypothetical protein